MQEHELVPASLYQNACTSLQDTVYTFKKPSYHKIFIFRLLLSFLLQIEMTYVHNNYIQH